MDDERENQQVDDQATDEPPVDSNFVNQPVKSNNLQVPKENTRQKRSIKRNLSQSFTSLIDGIRKSSIFTRRHASHSRPGQGRSKTVAPGTSSKATSLSSICSFNLCEAKRKSRTQKKELKASKKLNLSKSLDAKRRHNQNEEQLSSYQLSSLIDGQQQETATMGNDNKPQKKAQVLAETNGLGDKNKTGAASVEEKDTAMGVFKAIGRDVAVKLSTINSLISKKGGSADDVNQDSIGTCIEKEDGPTIMEGNIEAKLPTSLTAIDAISSPPLIPVYYELKINLKEGRNLAIRDIGGSSDPYVKFLLNGATVYKSKIIFRNLNPQWNEEVSIRLCLPSTASSSKIQGATSLLSLDNPPTESNPLLLVENLKAYLSKFKLKIFVFDYDRGFLSDDLIGYSDIELDDLRENIETQTEIELKDDALSKHEFLGNILMDLTLIPKYTDPEDKEIATSSSITGGQNKTQSPAVRGTRRAPYQLWQCVLNVVLIEANNLLSVDEAGLSDPYFKIRLENERYRSKTVRRSLNPRFLEQFKLYVYDVNKMSLELAVYDYNQSNNNDNFIGKTSIDLKALDPEKTHFVKQPLEDGAGTVSLLLTITGTYGTDAPTDLDYNKEAVDSVRYRDNIIRKYIEPSKGLLNSFRDLDDVGWLQIKILRAEGLASADMNGKSDPFCAIQLVNQYVQTHTEYKTLNPEWGKMFELKVNDIHAVLEITVLDEDKNKVYEFLGKIAIPLTNIQNGKRKMFALKDMKLMTKTKGAIELEMFLVYNPLKAVVRTFNPREEKYIKVEPKLKVPVLKQNIMRIHNLVQGLINTGNFIDSCFRWIYPIRSIVAFISFIIIVLSFEMFMLPLTLLVIFLKNYIIIKLKSVYAPTEDEDSTFDYLVEEEDSIGDTDANKEPKKSFREKLAEIQEICLKVQEALDYIASLGERIVNTFMFTTPWLSWLAIIVLLIASVILYMVPLRYLILIWGINKFTKKFRKPRDYVDNTEILDFLSRVPSKKELFEYREIKIGSGSSTGSAGGANNQANSNSAPSPNTLKKKKKA